MQRKNKGYPHPCVAFTAFMELARRSRADLTQDWVRRPARRGHQTHCLPSLFAAAAMVAILSVMVVSQAAASCQGGSGNGNALALSAFNVQIFGLSKMDDPGACFFFFFFFFFGGVDILGC